MSARDAIIDDLLKTFANYGMTVDERADRLIKSLTAACYSIVPTGRDPETIEACATVAEALPSGGEWIMQERAAAAIRQLGEKQ